MGNGVFNVSSPAAGRDGFHAKQLNDGTRRQKQGQSGFLSMGFKKWSDHPAMGPPSDNISLSSAVVGWPGLARGFRVRYIRLFFFGLGEAARGFLHGLARIKAGLCSVLRWRGRVFW